MPYISYSWQRIFNEAFMLLPVCLGFRVSSFKWVSDPDPDPDPVGTRTFLVWTDPDPEPSPDPTF